MTKNNNVKAEVVDEDTVETPTRLQRIKLYIKENASDILIKSAIGLGGFALGRIVERGSILGILSDLADEDNEDFDEEFDDIEEIEED